jgi:redox-sensitive bicupin YhaK (pirin superfamily)
MQKPKLTPYPKSETAFYDWGWRTMSPMFRGGQYDLPHRHHFGMLHVFNQGTIQPAQGYPMHPHQNMEIVTIPIKGQWEHKDSEGNLIHFGDGEVQIMSAGTGMAHSEFNASQTNPLTTMQFWLHTNEPNSAPRYEWFRYANHLRQNHFTPLVQPLRPPRLSRQESIGRDEGVDGPENDAQEGARILQNAWFSIGRFDQGAPFSYALKGATNLQNGQSGRKYGVFAYVLAGEFLLESVKISAKDALGIENTDAISGTSLTPDAQLLLVEVPMDA